MRDNRPNELHKVGTLDKVLRTQKWYVELRADLLWLRKQLLLPRLYDAPENRREEEANNIQTIIRGEIQRRDWRTIN
jgi:hypothetical protein